MKRKLVAGTLASAFTLFSTLAASATTVLTDGDFTGTRDDLVGLSRSYCYWLGEHDGRTPRKFACIVQHQRHKYCYGVCLFC
jgi:hypothetical protein